MNADFAKALIQAQKEFPAVAPDSTNPHFRSEFVSNDHLLAKTLPVLNRNGITLIQAPTIHEASGAPSLTTTLLHESGERIVFETPLLLEKQNPQGLGSAITYARRYALSSALGISTEKDDDANQASTPPAAPMAAQADAAPLKAVPDAVRAATMTPEEKRAEMVERWDALSTEEAAEKIAGMDLDTLTLVHRLEMERPLRKKKPRKTVLTPIYVREKELGSTGLEGEPSAAQGVPASAAQEEPDGFAPASPSLVSGPEHPSVSGPDTTTNGVVPLDRLKAAIAFIADQPSVVDNAAAWTVPGLLWGLSQQKDKPVLCQNLEEVPQEWIDRIWGAIPEGVRDVVGTYGAETLAAEAAKAK